MSEPLPNESENNPKPARRFRWWWVLLIIIGVFVIGFLAIQFIPVNRTNPQVTSQIQWDSPQTEALFQRACMDCHSNETTWPWYSRIAPVSWLVYYDTVRGRSQLNISTLGSSTGQDFASRFNQPTDLAYRLGQILAGENRSGGPGEGRFPPPNFTGQPPTGEGSQGGQQLPSRGFPAGGFSGNRVLERISEVINSGQMPPAKYTLIHPSAKLTADETQQLLQGLQATFGSTSP